MPLEVQTRRRDPLPQGWSYPIGLERLAVRLAAVPQQTLRVYFWTSGPGHLGCFVPCQGSRRLKGGDLLRAAAYSEVLAGWQKYGSWAVIVSAVASAGRAAIAAAIESTGVELLADWLSQRRGDTWHFGERRFQIALDAQAAGWCTREIHEDRVVSELFGPVTNG